MNLEPMIKQIILVTDGESNIGGNPVEAARGAKDKNIIVNTIGIMSQRNQQEKPFDEIINIAAAGGGSYELAYIDDLSRTIHSISYKTVSTTIQEVVGKQLQQILGKGLNEMAPEARSSILDYIDTYSDEISVCCCLLLDCSGSMITKIQSARHNIIDLLNSLKGRRGSFKIALMGFSSEIVGSCQLLHGFDENIQQLERNLYKLQPKGATPTAVAILQATELVEEYSRSLRNPSELSEFAG